MAFVRSHLQSNVSGSFYHLHELLDEVNEAPANGSQVCTWGLYDIQILSGTTLHCARSEHLLRSLHLWRNACKKQWGLVRNLAVIRENKKTLGSERMHMLQDQRARTLNCTHLDRDRDREIVW